MSYKARNLRLYSPKPLAAFFVVAVLALGVVASLVSPKEQVFAATNGTMNFQARLMNASGSIAPDGDYNVEFKIYTAAAIDGGETPIQGSCTTNPGAAADEDCVWIETRTGANKIHVANGYLTANLGSVTAFASTIDWNEELWLTMNIGGIDSPSWDGEMTPRLKLTAVPYAFRASQLASQVGSFNGVLQFASSFGQDSVITLPDPGAATATVCYQTAVACGFVTGTADDYIQNGTTVQAAANFNIRSAATGSVGAVIQGENGQTADLLQLQSWNGTTAINVLSVSKDGVLTVAGGQAADITTGTTNLTIAPGGTNTTLTLNSNGTGDLNVGTNAASKTINIGAVGTTASATTIHIGDTSTTTATMLQTITIGSNSNLAHTTVIQGGSGNGAGTESIRLVPQTTGGIAIGSTTGTGTITLGQSTAANTINIGNANFTAANAQTINIASGTQTTAASTLSVNILSGAAGSSGTGTLNLGNSDRVTGINIGNVAADASRTLNLFTGSNIVGIDTLNIGTGSTTVAGGKTINIGNGTPTGSGTNIITIGSNAALANTTTIQGGNGADAVSIRTAAGGTIQVGNTTTGSAQTVNIGTNATSGATNTIAIGAGTVASGTVAINSGVGSGNSITLQSNNSTGGTVVRTGTNSTTGFQIQNANANNGILMNIDTVNGWLITNATTHPNNILENPSFESNASYQASGWNYNLSSAITAGSADAHHGNNAMITTGNGATQVTVGSLKHVSVAPGDQFYVELWYKTAVGTTGGGSGASFSIAFYNANKAFLSNSSSTNLSAPNTTYTRASNTGTVPAGAYYVRMNIAVNAASTGNWYFDDLYMARISEIAPQLFKNSVNSSTAFQIQNTNSDSFFNADTAGNTISVGYASTTTTLSGTVKVATLGASTANSAAVCRDTSTNTLTACDANTTGSAFLQAGNSFGATGVLGTNDANNLQFETNNIVRATFDQSNSLYLGNGVTAATPNSFTINGTGSSTTAVTGGAITLQGGNATVGTANGGNVTITGGAGVGGGVRGLVVIDTPTITTSSVQNCASNCNVTQANIDSSGVVLINATNASLTATLSDPTITTAGRIMYVTAANGSSDFTLSVNGGGTGNTITMKPNTTATMIWNGSDWTAAGASSSTDLQAAYNNTASSAGAAELVLKNTATSNGLTVRNGVGTDEIIGGLFEVQNSIGSSLFSVNNNATEYASNGGAETAGASSSTFPSSTWSAAPAGGTISRYTTAGSNIATGAASVFVDTTTTANTGVANTLNATLTPNLKYRISYTLRHTSSSIGFATLDTIFSRDGTNTSTTSCATGDTATNGQWTRITCSFTAPSSGITSSNAIFIRHSDSVEHDFYVDNLSINVSADVSHAVDGSVDSALGTNWTTFGAGTAVTLESTNIYDTSGSVKVDTTNNTDRGVTNNLAITPSVSTQYLVTFYAKLSSGTFTDIRVRYSRDGGTNFAACVDYNTRTLSTSAFTKITCLFTTDGTTASNPDLIIDQPTAPGSTRTFYVDALSVTLNNNNASNVQIGGANKGGPTTLLTLDRSNGAPIAANNEAYLGSMYYDTSSGRIQCYEADGWGACGAAPDNIVNLNPEYAGAVLNGTGIGTMTADFCADQASISFQVNDTLCDVGEARNYYQWTSPQATEQTYSIYITYQLPATFNGFSSDDTIQLTARTDSTSNAEVTYQVYKSTGSALTQCGSGETDVIAGDGDTADEWHTYGVNGNEATGCGFNSSAAGNFVIFKINLKAKSNANAYVSTLSFTTTGR